MSFAEKLDEPLLAELFSYWSERCRGRKAPARADIDPIDIPHLLPHLALTEIVPTDNPDGFRIRYRLAGTEIEERFGCSLTNRFFDDLVQGPFVDYITDLYRRLRTEMAPHYSESSFGAEIAEALRAKRLLLPLSDDQQNANMVLVGVIFLDGNPHERKTVLGAHGDFTSGKPKNSG
ncbi:MAG: hypothetical protein Tsb0032_05170 [Kiloniellaceae bacterium]